jgi:hypothetical protein
MYIKNCSISLRIMEMPVQIMISSHKHQDGYLKKRISVDEVMEKWNPNKLYGSVE